MLLRCRSERLRSTEPELVEAHSGGLDQPLGCLWCNGRSEQVSVAPTMQPDNMASRRPRRETGYPQRILENTMRGTPSVPETLAEVESLVGQVKVSEAQDRLVGLLNALTPAEAASHVDGLQAAIALFLPRRRRELEATLKAKLDESAAVSPADAARSVASKRIALPSSFRSEIADGLDDLRQRHIFQWDTFYKELLADILDRSLFLHSKGVALEEIREVLAAEICRHAIDVFAKGFNYGAAAVDKVGVDSAVSISLAGLRHFLEIPIEYYSTQIYKKTIDAGIIPARRVCSAVLAGVWRASARHFLESLRLAASSQAAPFLGALLGLP